MIQAVWRRVGVYAAIATLSPKLFLAYSNLVWMQFFVRLLALVIYVSFWRAVYATTDVIAGLSYAQTLKYILLAQIFAPVALSTSQLTTFNELLREGRFGIELLRPVDFQAATYVQNLAFVGIHVVRSLPLLIVALVAFKLDLPTNPLVWLAFTISLLLGNTIMFCFDWILGCCMFYMTEGWGIIVARAGIVSLFSGALVPLTMMPQWLSRIAIALPFAQALSFPIEILSGIRPVESVLPICLLQIIGVAVLCVLSRLVFRTAVRTIIVQGG